MCISVTPLAWSPCLRVSASPRRHLSAEESSEAVRDLVAVVVNSLLAAGLYATMSYGLAVIYGVMRIINLAHAGGLMLGAYAKFTLHPVDPDRRHDEVGFDLRRARRGPLGRGLRGQRRVAPRPATHPAADVSR